jgi:hypothetical protein
MVWMCRAWTIKLCREHKLRSWTDNHCRIKDEEDTPHEERYIKQEQGRVNTDTRGTVMEGGVGKTDYKTSVA